MNHDHAADRFAHKLCEIQKQYSIALINLADEFKLNPAQVILVAATDQMEIAAAVERNTNPILDLLTTIHIIIKEEQENG